MLRTSWKRLKSQNLVGRRVQETVTIPHTALIYLDTPDRNRLLKSVINQEHAHWKSVLVLSSNPRADTKFFLGTAWKQLSPNRRRRVSSVDMKEVCRKEQEPTEDIKSIILTGRQGESLKQPPLIVGDWLHQVYDRFGVGLEVEEAEARRGMRNLICCYRQEGFWSLDCEQIARTFELHEQVLSGQTLLRMNGETNSRRQEPVVRRTSRQ